MKIKRSELTFVSAKATNTRLMGVVGLVAYWQDPYGRKVVQIYHLDYESYGIDGFHHLIEPDEETLQTLILGVTGGLGGVFVDIDFEAFKFLIKSAYVVDESCLEALVDFEWFESQFESLFVSLSLEEEGLLYEHLSPEMVSPEHLINYFIMRYVGCDYPSALMLWEAGNMDEAFELCPAPQTLIKNQVTLISESEKEALYRAQALIDQENQYEILVVDVLVHLPTLKVASAALITRMDIGSIEAAFNLSVPEYMLVTMVKDAFFKRRFIRNNPEMMKQSYPAGDLFIEFNANNAHVAKNPYWLSGDIYAMYFFGRSGHLIVCGLDPDKVKEIDESFKREGVYEDSLHRICELKADDPLLLTFINSAYENIFDFLSTSE